MRFGWRVIAAATGMVAAQSALAQRTSLYFDIPGGPLANSLEAAARKAGVSLLFDPARIASRQAPALHDRTTVDQAFAELLRGSGLAIRRLEPGTYVLVIPEVTRPPVELAVPDILVIGKRTLNTDIERRADDVQPYRVVTAKTVSETQPGSPQELLRARLAANLLGASLNQLGTPQGGSVRSQIDLRGLGTAQTLVLVDGRRMPSVPGATEFYQPDVNGIPIAAIERIETLGGTAGAIYGPGATGGVVNIVLKQDFPKAWIEGQSGIDERGDGLENRITGGFSLSSGSGRTRFNVMASRSTDQGLDFGDRSFTALAREYRITRTQISRIPTLFVGNNINIISQGGVNLPLVFLPQYGGASLGTAITNYPANAGGAGGNEIALLQAGAGRFDSTLSNDGSGSRQSLLTPSIATSFMGSLRQKIGSQFELFANALVLSDRGRAIVPATSDTYFEVAPGESGNPFNNTIQLAVPMTGLSTTAETRTRSNRVTAGLIVRLPKKWNIELDAALGGSSTMEKAPEQHLDLSVVDVFTPGTQLQDAIAALANPLLQTITMSNRMRDVSLRVAGPLARLPGGPLTMTVSGEYRDERTTGELITNADGSLASSQQSPHEQQIFSALTELRAPLVSATSPIFPLRGLTLQLAVRGDRYRITEPNQYDQAFVYPETTLEARHTTFAFTAGAKMTPLPGLTLRASYATGYLPPTPGQIVPSTLTLPGYFRDPQRPQLPDFTKFPRFISVTGGLPTLEPEEARTLALGVVAEPEFLPGLRISVDYTLIRKSNEIVTIPLTDQNLFQYFVTHDLDLPGRVTRAPLTAADAALGDTGGVIEMIDASALNVGRSTLKAVDFDVSYARSLSFGDMRVFASATWIPSYQRRGDPFGGYQQYAGKFDGPLQWKGNAGINWSRGRLSALVNAQYIGSYSVSVATINSVTEGNASDRIAAQGGDTLPPQAYVDLGVGYRFAMAGHPVRVQFGVKNVLNKTPPLFIPNPDYLSEEGSFFPGYSTYADPRGRRYVLTVGAAF